MLKSDLRPFSIAIGRAGSVSDRSSRGALKQLILKGLILAQNERWRRGLGMQVE
jgi:hypothetical protein